MYKIILSFDKRPFLDKQTLVFTYFDLDYCRKELPILKERYISMGCRILELAIYKVEQIQDPEQI